MELLLNSIIESIDLEKTSDYDNFYLVPDFIKKRQEINYLLRYSLCENDLHFKKILKEDTGITISPDNVIKFLKWKLKLKNWQFNKSKSYNNITSIEAEYDNDIAITIPDLYNNKHIIEKILNKFGYYLSEVTNISDENKWIIMIFHPLYLDNINDIVKQHQYIYHITSIKNKDNILKNGFITKSENKRFSYPKRCHFFIGDIDYAKLFKNEIENINSFPNDDYIIFTLDTNKINVDFYPDPNIHNGIITKENISPDAIINVEKI